MYSICKYAGGDKHSSKIPNDPVSGIKLIGVKHEYRRRSANTISATLEDPRGFTCYLGVKCLVKLLESPINIVDDVIQGEFVYVMENSVLTLKSTSDPLYEGLSQVRHERVTLAKCQRGQIVENNNGKYLYLGRYKYTVTFKMFDRVGYEKEKGRWGNTPIYSDTAKEVTLRSGLEHIVAKLDNNEEIKHRLESKPSGMSILRLYPAQEELAEYLEIINSDKFKLNEYTISSKIKDKLRDEYEKVHGKSERLVKTDYVITDLTSLDKDN